MCFFFVKLDVFTPAPQEWQDMSNNSIRDILVTHSRKNEKESSGPAVVMKYIHFAAFRI